LRVLVAEDETRLAKQVAAALAQAGYAVDCAGDGARADFLARTERYDAVVLDLGRRRSTVSRSCGAGVTRD
jgi:two-component system OmpR family response regulator